MLDLRLFLPKRVPLPLIALAVFVVVGSWVPLTAIFKHTQVKHEKPRIHLFQDMDNQPKLKAQAASPIFNDGRAMRQPVAGTVARGHRGGDDALERGYTVKLVRGEPTADFVTGFPDGIEVDAHFLLRGQKKFDTFCYPCHGKAGYGDGPVNERAMALLTGDQTLSYGTNWVPAANLNNVLEDGKLQFGSELYPNGRLYTTIVQGQGNMAGYGHALGLEDRWAIVAYVRALQLSQNTGAAQAAMDHAAALNPQTADAAPRPAAVIPE